MFCAFIFRSALIPSLTLTQFQKDPNTSRPTSQETSHLWESFFWAFSSTMPHVSGISHGHHITESSVSECTHGSFAVSFSCSHSLSPAPLANFFSLSSFLSLLSSLYPASSSLVSYIWLKDKSRWDLWPYTALMTYHTVIPVFAECVGLTRHSRNIEVKLATETCTDFCFLSSF